VVLDDGDGNPEGDGAYRKSEGLHPNEGHVSVVTGNGGASMSRRGTMPVMREILLEFGSVIIDVDGDTLKGIMLNKDGETRDLFSIVKAGKVTPERIEKPWQPDHDFSKISRHTLNFSEERVGTLPANWRIARGKAKGVAVALGEDGKAKFLRAEAGKREIIGLFEPLEPANFRYDALVRLSDERAGVAGIVFAYEDGKNFCRAVVDVKSGKLIATMTAAGKETPIFETPVKIEAGKWIKLEMLAQDGKLVFRVDDEQNFEVPSAPAIPKGQLGLFVPKDGNAEFMSFQIRL
jgi:hypothetical protein